MLYPLIKPLLFRLDTERAHDLISNLLAMAGQHPAALALLRTVYHYHEPRLTTALAGLTFANPLGLAAGFDKAGRLLAPISALGFGHIEIGTVTPRPQPGNPQPRLFRLPADQALINRLGFNSPGMLAVAQRLRQTEDGRRKAEDGRPADQQTSRPKTQNPRPKTQDPSTVHRPPPTVRRPPSILGINIGKNRTTALEAASHDYTAAFVALAPFADYIAINISSPNTPGLRQLHEHSALAELLGALTTLNQRLPQPRPLFLKLSPDETPAQLNQVAEVALAAGVHGLIASNTTLARDGLRSMARSETGGLSGQPLRERARATIAQLYRATAGQLPIIGVGGVASAADAYGHIRAGASLVQCYTGLIYHGPALPRQINQGLLTLLARDGFATLAEAVGADHT